MALIGPRRNDCSQEARLELAEWLLPPGPPCLVFVAQRAACDF